MATLREVDVELVRMSAAILRHREVTGRWPERTSDVVPEFTEEDFINPYTGEPFSVKVNGAELELSGLVPSGVNSATDQGPQMRLVKLRAAGTGQ